MVVNPIYDVARHTQNVFNKSDKKEGMIGGEEKMKRERERMREGERERDYEVSKMSFDVNIIYGLYNEYQMKQKI